MVPTAIDLSNLGLNIIEENEEEFSIGCMTTLRQLEQAYELNQKKRNCIIGGMLWLKMGNRMVPTAIDLSNLGLNIIEENEEEFSIGCMTTLRQLEQHEGLNRYTKGAVSESVRSIVGVQFRNLATVGGSIFGRFGFISANFSMI